MTEIGELLREERLRRGLTEDAAARAADAPVWVVTGLESGALTLDSAPNLAYLRMYSRQLGMDSEELLRTLNPDEEWENAPDQPVRDRHGRRRRLGRHVRLAGLGLLAAVAAIVGVVLIVGGPGGDAAVAPTVPAEGGAAGVADGPAPAPSPEPADPEPEDLEREDPEPEEPEGEATATRPPEETTVQVLHNNASPAVLEEVTAVLESLGYSVVQVNAASVVFERTTVFANEGWEPEGRALRDHDRRFGLVLPNARFSSEVHLHVAIGPDWGPEE